MIIKTATGVFLCALTLAVPALAATSEGGNRHYHTVWNIEYDPSQLGVRSISQGRPVLEQRLLPSGLAVAEEDILSDAGKVLVDKGSQLFQLDVNSGKTFCVVTVPRPSFYRSFMLGGGNLQLCLIDSDSNGVFDGQFNGGNPMKGVPFIEGQQPKKARKASGRYSTLNPQQFAQRYTVRITLVTAKIRATGEPSVGYAIDFGDDQTRQSLSDIIPGTAGKSIILGGEWNVTAVGDNKLTAEVSRSMPAQPFRAVRTVTFR